MVYYKININNTEIYIPKYQTPVDLNLIPELYNRLTTLDIGVLILTSIYKQVTKKYRTVYVGFTDGDGYFEYDTVIVLIPEYLLDKYERITVALEDIKRIKFYNKLEGEIRLANTIIDDSLKNHTNINFYLRILIKSLILSEFMKLNGIENYQLMYKKVNDVITFIKISELISIRLDPV